MERMEIPESNSFMYDEDYLEMLYESLEKEFHEEVNMDKKPSPKLIVFDDCGYSGSLKSKVNGIVSRMICNGRHLNLSQIYSSQKYSQCSTTLRTNITGAILFNTSAKELDLISNDRLRKSIIKKALKALFIIQSIVWVLIIIARYYSFSFSTFDVGFHSNIIYNITSK